MGNKQLVEAAAADNIWLSMKSPRDKKVLDALAKVDRIKFLPKVAKYHAYYDGPVSIGHDATCSMPSLVALMADMLELYDGANVLEVGTGCGYHAAVVKHLIGKGKLTTVEIVPELVKFGRQNLQKHFGSLDDKIEVIEGDGSEGYKQNAPYNRIYFTAAPNMDKFKTKCLLSQLSNNGILLFPEHDGYLYLLKKSKGKVKEEQYWGVAFVPLKGKNS